MNYVLPLIITFLAGLLMLVSEFIPHKPFESLVSELEIWFMIISGFAIVLGQISLLKMNIFKIKYKSEGWKYCIVTLSAFFIMLLVGILWGTESQAGLLGGGERIIQSIGEKPFDYNFKYIYQHLMASMFSLLAFFIASAAYRAFIARTLESALLLVSAIIVMLGNTSVGTSMTSFLPQSLNFLHLPNISKFIMDYPNTAGQRAIIIGAGLGIIGSSLRVILGIERSWIGGKK
ncbi:MAG: hypothetical protein RBS92_05920 [Candidatus Cloacimonadales bacterium]|jgi:hypothetical protein|nr:hypothetical protein [Candidatus Cloacimonadales bacterium]